jgi:hypothetical protein
MATNSLGTLTLDLIAKIGGFTAPLDKAERHADRRMRDIQKNAEKTGQFVQKAIGAIATGVAFRSIIGNTIEQERVTAQLEATMRSTGRYTPELSKELQGYAASLQTLTDYGDEAIIGSEALLLTFTQIGGDVFPRAQKSILDVATAMGTDLKAATLQVGKALNDPILGVSALAESGIQFTEDQKGMIRSLVETGDAAKAQGIILEELERQFGGSAEAARNTLGGSLKSLKNSFGDLLEGDSQGEGVKGAIASINDLTDVLNDPAVKQGFAVIVDGAVTAAAKIAQMTADIAGFIKFASEDLAATINGAAPDDLVRINEEIADLTGKIDRFHKAMEGRGSVSKWLDEVVGLDDSAEARLQGWQQRLDHLQQMVADFKPASPKSSVINLPLVPVGGGGSAGGLPADEDDFLKKFMEGNELRIQDQIDTADALLAEEQDLMAAMSEANDIRIQEGIDASASFWDAYLKSAEEALTSVDDLALSTIENFSSGMGNALESIVFDFENLGDAFDTIMESMARNMVNALGKMTAEWLAYKAVQALVGSAGQAGVVAAVSSEASTGVLLAGINAFSSTAAIPIVGPALAPGASAAAIAATTPMAAAAVAAASAGFAGAFDAGGEIPAGMFGLVGERGPELVSGPAHVTGRMDTQAVFDKMAQDKVDAGGGREPQVNIRIVNVDSVDRIAEAIGSDPVERAILNVGGRNPEFYRKLANG